jgi:lipid-A-disaccharide synthase
MRYYIIAGEASGDLHGSALMKALTRLDPDADFRFWGGDLMMKSGGIPVRHIKETSLMGFWEVAKNLPSIYANIRYCKKDIVSYGPDALILIDYPGFNMRMARFAKRSGIRVFYYISPKVWAWNQSRVKKIRKYVDHMLTIFPFETDFYKKFGYHVDYVGNPLMDALAENISGEEDFGEFTTRNGLSEKPIIAVLPGSRIQEIEQSLRIMISAAVVFPHYQAVIAGASTIDEEAYRKYGAGGIPILFNQTHAILRNASAAMVVSGTATLEAALLRVPLVVCYRGSYLSYQIARRFIKVKYISLVNLIMSREVVKELIQDDFNTGNLVHEIDRLLHDKKIRQRMAGDLAELGDRVGPPGASENAAQKIIEYLASPGRPVEID